MLKDNLSSIPAFITDLNGIVSMGFIKVRYKDNKIFKDIFHSFLIFCSTFIQKTKKSQG